MGNYTEKELRETLGQEVQESEQVEKRLEEVYAEIRSGSIKRKKRRTSRYAAAGTVAAVFAAGIFCVSNPAIAAKLPLIGHIFEELGKEASYPGDYDKVAVPLMTEDEPADTAEDELADVSEDAAADNGSPYVCTSGNMTMTLSEVYCNDLALYLTMELRSEEVFEESSVYGNGTVVLNLQGNASPDFSEQSKDLEFGELAGKMVDDHTYIGIYRMELADTMDDGQEMKRELPDKFRVQLAVDRIIGRKKDALTVFEAAGIKPKTEEEVLSMSDEEWKAYIQEAHDLVPEYNFYPNPYMNFWYDGPFNFDLEVSVDRERTVKIPVDEDGTDGFCILSVTRTPFELEIEAAGRDNDMIQVLDADGKRLQSGWLGGVDTMLAAEGHDLSEIDIYCLPWEDFETTVKGDYFDKHETDENGKTLRELLEENSTYHRKVVFEEKY